MKRLLLALLLAIAVGVPALTAPGARAATEQTYIAVGDSIAAGLVTSLPRVRGYPALVAGLMSKLAAHESPPGTVRLVNLAVPGETATSFMDKGQLQRFSDEVSALKGRGGDLRAVTVTLGGNEVLALQGQPAANRQAGLDQFRASYPAALSAIRQALGDLHPAMVVTTYYDVSGGDPSQQGTDAWWLAQFNDVIRSTAQTQGMTVADLEPAFRGHIAGWTWYPPDVHPNNAGHEEIARLVWQALGFDQQPPSVTIVRPQAGPLSRRVPTVEVKATDNVGVTRVQLQIGDRVLSDLLYLPDQDAYYGIWDARDYSGQDATLTVHAYDLAGHDTSANVHVTLPGS